VDAQRRPLKTMMVKSSDEDGSGNVLKNNSIPIIIAKHVKVIGLIKGI